MLNSLFGKLDGSSMNAASSTPKSLGVLREFDQREFIDAYIPWEWAGLAERGLVYYPNACKTAGSNCKVHMTLHGCSGSPFTKIDLGDTASYTLKDDNGLLQYAATNNMVVIMPVANMDLLWPNTGECFDGKGMY